MGRNSKTIYLVLALVCTLMLATFLGCTVQRRPDTPPPPPEQGQNNVLPPPQNPMVPAQPGPGQVGDQPAPGQIGGDTRQFPADHNQLSRIAQQLGEEAARVNGVRGATVVITGNTALVGIEVEPNIPADQINNIQRQVATTVQQADNRIDNVSVTADPDLVTRIRNIGQGITEGRPVTEFGQQITEIINRIGPAVR